MATIDKVREAMHAVPFRPFTVHLVDGRTYFVRHPDFVSIPTTDRGRDLTIHDDDAPDQLVGLCRICFRAMLLFETSDDWQAAVALILPERAELPAAVSAGLSINESIQPPGQPE